METNIGYSRALDDELFQFAHSEATRRVARQAYRLISPIEPPMSHDPHQVARRQVEISNALGLHLRPADKFVRLAHQFQSEIRVYHEGNEINGKSILDLTTLAAECGTVLDLEARGADAEAAVEALAQLVLERFHETEEGQDKDSVG